MSAQGVDGEDRRGLQQWVERQGQELGSAVSTGTLWLTPGAAHHQAPADDRFGVVDVDVLAAL